VRFLDLKNVTGGVLHAKYFVVDGREAYLGSQNFDWRSLEHIQELGVQIKSASIAAELQRTFELDWQLADPARPPAADSAKDGETRVAAVHAGRAPEGRVLPGAGPWLVASPRDLLAPGATWDLPQLVRLIDGAREHIRVQLLTYKMSTRDDGYWDELESALRRAAARRVKVELLVADWCKRKGTIEGLQGLEPLENIAVKLVTIPPWSGGFVPYGRVVHAKYMVVDGARAWLGTSNWERDYFYSSRNVGLVVEDTAFADQLERFFASGWNSSYATPVDPCATYTAPKIGD
jgi:phosphatidylserine/phosphatidylglycerophosphate/cardiolipin synthase-like enzyme